MVQPISSLFHKSYTISDSGKPLETIDIVLVDVDFYIKDFDVKVGDQNEQEMPIVSGNYLSYRHAEGINLKDFWFKNSSAGDTATVIVNGILKGI